MDTSQQNQQKQASELMVITKAKDLCSYVFMITNSSPKRFRFTFVSRMQNLALEIAERLFRANEEFLDVNRPQSYSEPRREHQKQALVSVKLLAYFTMLAKEQGCILAKQYQQIAKMTTECQRLIAAWIASDKKRLSFRSAGE